METHQTLESLVWRLAKLGMLRLSPECDAAASDARQQVTRAELTQLAARQLDTSDASIVVVGPRQQLTAQVRALRLGEPEAWSAEGRPLPAP